MEEICVGGWIKLDNCLKEQLETFRPGLRLRENASKMYLFAILTTWLQFFIYAFIIRLSNNEEIQHIELVEATELVATGEWKVHQASILEDNVYSIECYELTLV